jgi:molecular chaperone HscB
MPAPDYFEFFGLPRQLTIDAAGLERRFHRLSRELHPDRHVRSTPAERARALDASAVLNDAYRTLRNPVARAEYFLKRQDAKPPADPDLLDDVFELNVALEELRAGDDSVCPRLKAAHDRFLAMRNAIDDSLPQLFAACDAGAPPDEIRAALDRRKYIDNLVRQVESELGARA